MIRIYYYSHYCWLLFGNTIHIIVNYYSLFLFTHYSYYCSFSIHIFIHCQYACTITNIVHVHDSYHCSWSWFISLFMITIHFLFMSLFTSFSIHVTILVTIHMHRNLVGPPFGVLIITWVKNIIIEFHHKHTYNRSKNQMLTLYQLIFVNFWNRP